MEKKELKKVVSYYRVSSKRQKDEGVSLGAQKKLITEYARRNNFQIIKEFSVDESAKKENRVRFNQMIEYVNEHEEVIGIVAEKVDRLLRGNLKDRILIEDLINIKNKEIHYVKESMVLTKESRSADKLHFDIQNALARHYLNNLSDEVKKGYDYLISGGYYPHMPPLGYHSKLVDHLAVIDPDRAPYIKRAFELCATGEYSVKKISELLFDQGLRSRKGKRVGESSIGKKLHDPFYYGWFWWQGQLNAGQHEPIVDKNLFDQVQEILNPRKRKGYKHDFAYTGLMTCGECGNGITAEVQKGHVYYRCTKPKGANKCSQKYVREEDISKQLIEVVKSVSLDVQKISILKDILRESNKDEADYHEKSLEALNRHYKGLAEQSNRLLDLYLVGRLKQIAYDIKSKEIESETEKVNKDIIKHKNANKAYVQEVETFLDFCNLAPTLFSSSRPSLQRELLGFIVSNLVLRDKKLEIALKMPFSIVAQYSNSSNWRG